MDEASQRPEILAYPNPAKDIIYLKSRGIGEYLSIEILSNNGQMLEKTSFTAKNWDQELSFDTSNWPPGVYYIKTFDGEYAGLYQLVKN